MKTRTAATLAMCLALSGAACSSSSEGGETSSGTGGGDQTAGGRDASGGGGAGEAPADLFGCELPRDCFMEVGHQGESITTDAAACVSGALLGGGYAVLFATFTPSPKHNACEHLTVLLGDGTAFQQVRCRCEALSACGEPNPNVPDLLAVHDVELCDVVAVDYEPPAKCGFEDGERCVYQRLENCVVLTAADFTCDAASAP